MSDFVPRPLSHIELQKMILEHQKYRSSKGKEGKLIDLSDYVIEDFNFSGQDLNCINARISIFLRCKFTNCDLSGSYFSDSEFIDVDFSDAMLVKTELYDVKARNTCFDRANLRRAEFMGAELVDVSFRNADLGGGILTESELIRTIFDGANIAGAAVDENQETDTSWINVNGMREAA